MLQLRESSGMEGGGGRCQKCAQMQDELTRNLREKADDKQQLLRLEKDMRDLQAQLAKAEATAKQTLTVSSPDLPACAYTHAVILRAGKLTL